jgi:hypothetical protein
LAQAATIHEAARSGDAAAVSAYLAAGGDPNARDQYGWSLLHSAASGHKRNTAEILLAHGANVNAASTTSGHTPLHVAALGGDQEMAALLLSKGADRTLKNKDGKTPLDLAAENGHAEIVALLQGRANSPKGFLAGLGSGLVFPIVYLVKVVVEWTPIETLKALLTDRWASGSTSYRVGFVCGVVWIVAGSVYGGRKQHWW